MASRASAGVGDADPEPELGLDLGRKDRDTLALIDFSREASDIGMRCSNKRGVVVN
jgi:hypothetical protein